MFDKNTHFYKTTVILFFKKVIKLRSNVYLFDFQIVFICHIPCFRFCFQKYGLTTKKASRETITPRKLPCLASTFNLKSFFQPKNLLHPFPFPV